MKRLKLTLKVFGILLLLLTITLILSEVVVTAGTDAKLFSSVEDVPQNKVGLLLGTSKRLTNGRRNLYYSYRIDAAVALFESGKIDYILVSGDNGTRYYNEPTTMQQDLIDRGIPAGRIVLDYAGFRTLDSIVRCKEVFGQEKVTVISQPFHNERALFIASRKGLEAVGFNARDVSSRYGLKVRIREQLARVKVIWDILVGVEPKFLGEPVEIGVPGSGE